MKSESCKRTSKRAAGKSCGHKKEMTEVEKDWEQKAKEARELRRKLAAIKIARQKMILRVTALDVIQAEVEAELGDL